MKISKRRSWDQYVIIAMEAILVCTLLISIFMAIKLYIHQQNATLVIGGRGTDSMKTLAVIFSGIMALYDLVIIQGGDSLKGKKVAILLFNKAALAYMFFFNTWFKEIIFGLSALLYNSMSHYRL